MLYVIRHTPTKGIHRKWNYLKFIFRNSCPKTQSTTLSCSSQLSGEKLLALDKSSTLDIYLYGTSLSEKRVAHRKCVYIKSTLKVKGE